MDSSDDRVEAVGHSLHRAKRWVGPGLPTPDGTFVPTLQENVPRVGAVSGMPAGDPPSRRLCRAQDRRLSVQYPDGLTWAGHQRAWSAVERGNHAAAGVIHPQRQMVRCGSLAKPVSRATLRTILARWSWWSRARPAPVCRWWRPLGDTAYGDGSTRQTFVDAGRKLVARVQGRPNRKHFPKEYFAIDLMAGSCTCPAGQVTRTIVPPGKRTDSTGTIHRLQAFRFEAAVC